MPLYTDLRELKAELEIDPGDTSEDKRLCWMVEAASSWIETLLRREFVYKTRTRVYPGAGTQKLVLKHRPVYPNPPAPYAPLAVVEDSSAYFGAASGAFGNDATSTPLVYGVDYTIRIDRDDGGSKAAVLYRINNLWNRPQVRQAGLLSPFVGPDFGSYQVTYTAGYTVDSLPAEFRLAVNLIVANMRNTLPLGLILGGESYEDRSISVIGDKNEFWLSLVKPLVWQLQNWHF